MALSITIKSSAPEGGGKKVEGFMAFDDSYANGGEPLTAAMLGLSLLQTLQIEEQAGYAFNYVPTNDLGGVVKAYRSASPSGSIAITPHADSAGTPSGTNAASFALASYVPQHAVAKPVIALTHAADPTGGGNDGALYAFEAYAAGGADHNLAVLQSICHGAANVVGSVADAAVWGTNATPRFYVEHAAAPAGVQIYVNEASADQLECVSPTGEDCFIVLPFEAIANVPPGFAVAIRVHHSATAATGKPLYFDDDGLADAQLIFTDAGAAGGVVPAADVYILGPAYTGLAAGEMGSAQAQGFTGTPMGNHSHASTAAFTGGGVAPEAEVTATFNLSAAGCTKVFFSAFGR